MRAERGTVGRAHDRRHHQRTRSDLCARQLDGRHERERHARQPRRQHHHRRSDGANRGHLRRCPAGRPCARQLDGGLHGHDGIEDCRHDHDRLPRGLLHPHQPDGHPRRRLHGHLHESCGSVTDTSGSTTGPTLTITLPAGCVLAAAGQRIAHVAGITNAPAATYPAASWTINTSADTTTASPAAAITIAAATAPTAVTFAGAPQTGLARATWTVGYTATTALKAADTITVGFPAGFSIPTNPTVTLGGGYAGTCTNPATAVTDTSGSTTGPTLTITLPAGCTLAAAGNGSLTVAGITNAPAASYPATSWTIVTSSDTNTASPASAVTLGASTSPTAVTFSATTRAAITTGATWTAQFSSSASGALSAGDTIAVSFPNGFLIPDTPVVALTGAGYAGCGTPSASTAGTTVTVTLGAGCTLAASNVGTLTIAGITNPIEGTYAKAGFTVATSRDMTPTMTGAEHRHLRSPDGVHARTRIGDPGGGRGRQPDDHGAGFRRPDRRDLHRRPQPDLQRCEQLDQPGDHAEGDGQARHGNELRHGDDDHVHERRRNGRRREQRRDEALQGREPEVSVTDGSISGNASLTVGPAAASRLVVTGSATQTAGAAQSLTITATDPYGNTDTSYTGSHNLTFSGANSSTNPVTPPTVTNNAAAAINFGSATAITFTNGVSTSGGSMKLYKVESPAIAVTDGTISSAGSDRLTVAASAAAASKLDVTTVPAGNVTAGANFSVTFVSEDAYGNVSNVVATTSVTLNPSGAGTISNNTGTIVAGTNTQTLSTVQYTKAGALTLVAHRTAGDVLADSASSASITIVAGAFAKLQLLMPGETAAPGTASGKTGSPSAQTAGSAFTVTVNAVDANWNPVNSTDTVGITSTDAERGAARERGARRGHQDLLGDPEDRVIPHVHRNRRHQRCDDREHEPRHHSQRGRVLEAADPDARRDRRTGHRLGQDRCSVGSDRGRLLQRHRQRRRRELEPGLLHRHRRHHLDRRQRHAAREYRARRGHEDLVRHRQDRG